MARITTIDSLKKALKVAKNQVTIQDLLNERINLKTTGYSKIILTDDFRELLLDSTMQALNSNSSKVRAVINRGAQHWGLDRIFIENYGSIKVRYCAGQDYPSELIQIRRQLTAKY